MRFALKVCEFRCEHTFDPHFCSYFPLKNTLFILYRGTYDSWSSDGYFPTDGYTVITFPLNKYMDCTVKDNTVESYGFAYSSAEITRIKGTITILK